MPPRTENLLDGGHSEDGSQRNYARRGWVVLGPEGAKTWIKEVLECSWQEMSKGGGE
jgi:hypothetical protein